MKASEDVATGLISENEYRVFQKGFNNNIKNAKGSVSALSEELVRLDSEAYVGKLIQRFLDHRDIVKLERLVVARLIKSIVVSRGDGIKINFRYLDRFEE